MVVPLLAIPFLARTIAVSDYGVYMYAIGFSGWVSIFVEYGFNISSTRDIASGRAVLATVASTQSARAILTLLTLPFLILAALVFPVFSDKSEWAFVGWLFGVLTAFSPIYYFQGTEKLHTVGIVEIVSSGILLGGIYFFIKNENDFILLPYILLASKSFGLAVLTGIMAKETGLRGGNYSIVNGFGFIKKGFDFFVFQAVVSLYTTFNVVYLGFFCSPSQVGVYASAERLMRAGLGFIGQASHAIFPRVNILKLTNFKEMLRIRRLMLILFFVIGCAGMVTTWAVSPYIAKYYYGGRVDGVDAVLNIMAFAILPIALSTVLAYQYMMVDKREKVLNIIIICCALVSLPVSFELIKIFGFEGMAYSWVIIESVIAISIFILVFGFKKTELNKVEGV